MKAIKLFILSTILLTGCSVSIQTYDFIHHGTESLNSSSSFKYVEQNVTGKAKTTYYPQKWRKNQDKETNGLISAAKQNLFDMYPLENNQALANVSIDVIKTTKGKPAGLSGVVIPDAITVEVVVSADIIEYY